jgi:Trk K+ transport system NAD-binding subunit
MDVRLSQNVMVVYIDRGNTSFAPKGDTVLLENDILTISGATRSINRLYNQFILAK